MIPGQPYIVLIDDDPDDLEMLSSGLVATGTRVKSFVSFTKALFYLDLVSGNKDMPALIIMDYNMPMKNGYDVLVMLKQNPETLSIPVYIYSTTISLALHEKLMLAGAAGCFMKPDSFSELGRQVRIFNESLPDLVS